MPSELTALPRFLVLLDRDLDSEVAGLTGWEC